MSAGTLRLVAEALMYVGYIEEEKWRTEFSEG